MGDKTRVITCLLEEHTFYKRCLQVSTAFTPAMFNIGCVLQPPTFKDRLMRSYYDELLTKKLADSSIQCELIVIQTN